MILRDAYLAVRDVDANGAPVVPDSWGVTAYSGGWHELTRDDGIRIHAYRANMRNGVGLFFVRPVDGDARQVLDEFASRASSTGLTSVIAPLRAVWGNRATNDTARLAMRHWPDWQVSGLERDAEGNAVPISNVRRRLLTEGNVLPDPLVDPLPWDLDRDGALTTQASAVIRVETIHRPSIRASILGYDDVTAAETTE